MTQEISSNDQLLKRKVNDVSPQLTRSASEPTNLLLIQQGIFAYDTNNVSHNNSNKYPKSSYLWGYKRNPNTLPNKKFTNDINNFHNQYSNNNANLNYNHNTTNNQYNFNRDISNFITNQNTIYQSQNTLPMKIQNKNKLLITKNQINKIPIPISDLQKHHFGNINVNNSLKNQANLYIKSNQTQNQNQKVEQKQKQNENIIYTNNQEEIQSKNCNFNQNQNDRLNLNKLSKRTQNKLHLSKVRRKPRERRSWCVNLKTQNEKNEFLNQINAKKNNYPYYTNFTMGNKQFLPKKNIHQAQIKSKNQDQSNQFQSKSYFNQNCNQNFHQNHQTIRTKIEMKNNTEQKSKNETKNHQKTITVNDNNGYNKNSQPSPRTLELRSFGHRRSVSYDSEKVPNNSNYERFTSIDDAIGRIYLVAKDQFGCRFLQKQIENTQDTKITKIVLDEIYNHLIEIIIDPFGNYLIQKMFEYATIEDKSLIFKQISPELPSISLNQYGTRAVQKMIELIDHPDLSSILIHGIKTSLVELANDPNGNHILQKCLLKLTEEDKKYIYQGMVKHCVVISTHKHCCCVMQRCIDSAKDKDLELIVQTITEHSFILIRDRYANYVIQYILDKDFVSEKLANVFKENLYSFSIQKFSSNVVEKCLKVFHNKYKQFLIYELINMPKNRILKLLKDRYANYVIQTALDVANDKDNEKLSDVIFPHLPSLKKTRYMKIIQQKIYRNTTLTENLTLNQKRNMGHVKSKSWQRSTTLKKW
ncbi:pumilio homology domain family member 4 [Anaeramoeba flamelloides]|uniref:Pumilio homology domain family member 4 n=1 Tax=Anaeramoeba flamelloides TaxID=1746091 RepID=A0ABQ8XBU1_9EUKA|nr:pumilio homology domain family member 4 [Anaeramoeba flamelloides]